MVDQWLDQGVLASGLTHVTVYIKVSDKDKLKTQLLYLECSKGKFSCRLNQSARFYTCLRKYFIKLIKPSESRFSEQANQSVRYVYSCLKCAFLITMSTNNLSQMSLVLESSVKPSLLPPVQQPRLGLTTDSRTTDSGYKFVWSARC